MGVRGLLRPGGYNDAILLLVNGHTYNDDIYGQAFLGTEFGIDMEAIERIEVVRGPSSALYGGNAMFAVVNVVTSPGQELPGLRPLVETGSYGRKRAQISLGHVFGNGLDIMASGSVLDLDGHSDLYFPEYNSPETNNGVAHDADGERALNFFFSARYADFFLQGGVNRREKHVPTGAFSTTFNDPGTETIDGRHFAELHYTREATANVMLAARAYYDGYRYRGTYIYGSGSDREENEDYGTSHWLGAEISGEWQLARHTLTVGGEYSYHPVVEQTSFIIGGADFLDDRRSFSNWGIYAQDDWRVFRDLNIVAGVRVDQHYHCDPQLTPRLAAIWRVHPGTVLKLLVGKAFRQPSMYERYYTSPGVGTIAGPRLLPEKMKAYEAVLEQQLWQVWAAVSLYQYELFHLIDQVPVDADGETLLQFQNGRPIRAHGAELELRIPLPYGLIARGSYSIQETRMAGGQLLANSPKHLGNLSLRFRLPPTVEGGAELQLVGPRETLARRQVGTQAVGNLTLNWHSPLRGLDLDIGLYNIFNQHYADPGGIEHLQDEIPQDGFTFRVSVHYGW